MTLTATIYDEGDRPIAVFGSYQPAEPEVGLFEPDVELEGAELDGAPYDLSKVEQDRAREALLEAHRGEVEKMKAQREDAAIERRREGSR